MSEDRTRSSTERGWLAVRLYAEGVHIDEIARRLPRTGHGGRPAPEAAVGISWQTAFTVVQYGVRMLLAHVMRDEPPPYHQRHLWPPEEARRTIRAISGQRRRAATLKRWLRGRSVDGDGTG